MLTKEENDLLCRVGPETPMGKMIRRYWLPILTSAELEINGDPKRVRLLGEDLVAFRDRDGRIGLLDELCPHRRASLALGRNENGALECLYHGWRIECTGRILDMPVEPEESTFNERIRATAYATYETAGVIWAYLGPAESMPPKPDFPCTAAPADRLHIIREFDDCNWAQRLEGSIDSAHTNLLHQNGVRPSTEDKGQTIKREDGTWHRPSRDMRPRMDVQDTSYGFGYGAIRKPIEEPERQNYVRVTQFIAPVFSMFPPPKGWTFMQAFVPVDDYTTLFWFFHISDTPLTDADRHKLDAHQSMLPGIDLSADLRLKGNRHNHWLQDRAAMRRGESHTGIRGINPEDAVIVESMGQLLDRSKEHLGVSDTAIIRFRRVMLDAVQRFQNGGTPLGLGESYARIRADEGMVPIDSDWRDVFSPEPTPA